MNYLQNPSDPELNFMMALEYDQMGQHASAVSYT